MNRRHAMDSAACWCEPALFIPCPECEPQSYRGAAQASLLAMPMEKGCWACANGLRAVTRAEASANDACVVLVHRT